MFYHGMFFQNDYFYIDIATRIVFIVHILLISAIIIAREKLGYRSNLPRKRKTIYQFPNCATQRQLLLRKV